MASRKISLRLVLATLSVFSILLLALLAYATYRISDVKEPLISLLRDHIDGELKIDSANVVFFPIGINLKGVHLYAPGEEKPSATVKKAKLRFKIIPLIQKKIETNLTIVEPEIFLRKKKGQSNMEQIFAPMIAGEKKGQASKIDQFWWKKIAVNRLTIKNAFFKATDESNVPLTELQNIQIEADRIRFDSKQKPADIKISYILPHISKMPMELKTQLEFQDKKQAMKLKEGKFLWGPLKLDLMGMAFLPGKKQKDISLDINFEGKKIPLKKLSKILIKPLPIAGEMEIKGTVKGSPYTPTLTLFLDSEVLQIKDVSLNKLHAEIQKEGKPIYIKKASMGVYDGSLNLSGEILPKEKSSAKLKVKMSKLSLAAISGKNDTAARLSGNLKLKSPELQNPKAYSGGGNITVGPFSLPPIDLKNKVRVAEILSSGTGLGNMVNIGMLSNSSNVIGTRIDQVRASVGIGGGNLNLKPFSMGNGHFNAAGMAKIIQQKTIQGGGTFSLNRRVTSQLIPDRTLRNTLTNGGGKLSFPFTISGLLGDPDVKVDSGYLKSQVAKATLIMLQKQALSGVNPNQILGAAIKGTPAGDPKHPLGQILGTAPRKAEPNPTTRTRRRETQTKEASRPTTGNAIADQLLFGN